MEPTITEYLQNGLAFTMIYVEGGQFEMGSEAKSAYSWEKPIHRVQLDGFYIGKFPVTQAVWEAVMGNNPSFFVGENRPVEQVSWNDCQKFFEKLSQRSDRLYRLPTEAEWEYAARGGQKSQDYLYAGSDKLTEVGWFKENSDGESKDVGQKQPNELGLYEMSGNVWEWCQDWYSDGEDGYYQACARHGLVVNPRGPESGGYRVIRGGSWLNYSGYCRSSYRYYDDPEDRGLNLGFRLVLSPSQLAVHPGLPVS